MNSPRKCRAFSLAEVTLALGVIGFALVAILALIPVGQNSSRDAADDTRVGLIEQDVFARARAAVNSASTFSSPPSGLVYYYTNEGVFFSDNSGLATAISNANSARTPLPNFASTVTFGSDFATALPNVDRNHLKPVVVSIGWPLDPSGNIIGANSARKTCTFYIRAP
jgi:uncharacterized protein (TIGR02598 family)